MVYLIFLALAPILIILTYIYYRDQYEKEPWKLLLESLIAGGVIVFPIIYFEKLLGSLGSGFIGLSNAAWTAFTVASFVEEVFKYLAVILLIWRNINFNEKFDGIVYAVFVSLGFALVENIMYVITRGGGLEVGIMRAFTAVPAHAMFGVMMGYWLGKARFARANKSKYLFKAFIYPFIFHGIYDFILMSQKKYLLVLFIPLLFYMFYRSRKRIKSHEGKSVFNPSNLKKD